MRKHLIAFAALASTALSALAANPMVELKTNQGEIVVEVFADKAPKSAENFVQYVKDGHYDGTVFHRVIDGFMVQGGGFDADMNQKSTRAPIENEAKNGLKNEPGTLAMARTADPHSASAQFFINLVPNTSLDYPSRDGWGYAVFGKVVKGMSFSFGLRQAAPMQKRDEPLALASRARSSTFSTSISRSVSSPV